MLTLTLVFKLYLLTLILIQIIHLLTLILKYYSYIRFIINKEKDVLQENIKGIREMENFHITKTAHYSWGATSWKNNRC